MCDGEEFFVWFFIELLYVIVEFIEEEIASVIRIDSFVVLL